MIIDSSHNIKKNVGFNDMSKSFNSNKYTIIFIFFIRFSIPFAAGSYKPYLLNFFFFYIHRANTFFGGLFVFRITHDDIK